MPYHYTALILLLTVLLQVWILARVGRARARYAVPAPAVTGHPDFERHLRVQANTVENLLMFLPALGLCAFYLGDRWAAAAGAVWLVGRVLYAVGYSREAKQRETGFTISAVAIVALLLGGGYGLLNALLA